jgi:hypothetical protein
MWFVRVCLLLVLASIPALALPLSVRAQHHSPSHGATSVRIFYVALGNGAQGPSQFGCGDRLVAVLHPIPATRTPLRAALHVLLADHHANYGQSGLYNALHRSRLAVQRVVISNGRASVRLVGTLSQGGECDSPRIAAQLRHTILQFSTVRSTSITINGVPLWKRLSLKG